MNPQQQLINIITKHSFMGDVVFLNVWDTLNT